MSTKHRWVLLLVAFFSVMLLVAGCKKKKPPEPINPTSGPKAPTVAPDPDPDDDPGYRPPSGQSPVGWPHQQAPNDVGPRPDARMTKVVKGKPISTDADIAAFKEAKAKQETEKAVEASVNGVLDKVKGCFQQHNAAPGQRTLKVRVHRSGRVLSSNVSGVSGEVNRCIEGVLSQLHVSGMQTDTIDVERKLNYTK